MIGEATGASEAAEATAPVEAIEASGGAPLTSDPRIGVVELRLSPDLACVGEYLHAGTQAASVVLLHDRDRDLDDLHPLAWELHAAGFNVVNLDLPGHGLSEGDYEQDSARAIAAAGLFADPNFDRGVAFVAEGETCHLLLTSVPLAPIAMVLLRPQSVPAGWTESSTWPRTPALLIVDPADEASDSVAADIVAGLRAWNVRGFVHRDAGDMWQVQTSSLATRFLLEQRTYWASRLASEGLRS
jgi:hypothetical protein